MQNYLIFLFLGKKVALEKRIGRPVLNYHQTDSTNLEAWRLLRRGKAGEGMVIVAGSQSKGRGQAGAHWESEPGKNLLLSVVLAPHFLPPEQQFQLSKAVSLALHDAVREFLPGKTVHIKWPNDLYVGHSKVAGILIENAIAGSRLEHAIAGIGLNVNQRTFAKDLPNPTSLALEAGHEFDLMVCLELLLEKLDRRYKALRREDTRVLDKAYLEHLWGYRREMEYLSDDRPFKASIEGLDPYGRLMLRDTTGKEKAYDMKEVRLVSP